MKKNYDERVTSMRLVFFYIFKNTTVKHKLIWRDHSWNSLSLVDSIIL